MTDRKLAQSAWRTLNAGLPLLPPTPLWQLLPEDLQVIVATSRAQMAGTRERRRAEVFMMQLEQSYDQGKKVLSSW